MPTLTPGVSFESVDAGPTAIPALRTDIAGMVGVADQGPVGTPVPVESFRQFESVFGGLSDSAMLAFAVKAFFENGGARCQVVRAAAPESGTSLDPAIPLDPSGATSAIFAAPGFVTGAVVTLIQDGGSYVQPAAAEIVAVDATARRVSWAAPLDPELWLDCPIRFVAGGVVAVTDGTQPVDRASSIVQSTAGLAAGMSVQVRQPSRRRIRRHLAADASGTTIVWDTPLEPELRTDPGLTLQTGAVAASATFENLAGVPTLTIAAASPGSWANALTLTVRSAGQASTVSAGAALQPADRTASRVADVGSFVRGDLVRIDLPDRPGAPVFAVVSSIDPIARTLIWQDPDPRHRLPSDGPLPASFDGSQPFTVTRIDLSIVVTRDGVTLADWARLSLVPQHPRYAPAILAAATTPPIALDLSATDPATPAALVIASATRGFDGGGDGLAAITPGDMTGAGSVTPLGAAALAGVDEVAILLAPDAYLHPRPQPQLEPPAPPAEGCVPCCCPAPVIGAAPYAAPAEQPPVFGEEDAFAIQAALVAQAEALRDRVCVLDPPPARAAQPQEALALAQTWRGRFDTAFAALYYPWLVLLDPRASSVPRAVPSSGHMAGAWAATDLARGVHWAPANLELAWCHAPVSAVDDQRSGLLNTQGIDAIRALPGRGIRPYGARTLSSDPQWRYVPVRRLMCMVEKAISHALQFAVFEPADVILRELVRISIDGLLGALWQRGAFVGDTADEAYFVVCDDTLNPPSQVADGILVAEVGVAPAIPSEFIVVRVGRTSDALRVYDPAAAPAGMDESN